MLSSAAVIIGALRANLLLQIAPNVVLTDEEIEYRQKTEFQAFCEEENAFLRELGLIKDEELPIPE